MSLHLTVINQFGNYVRGNHITDPEEIKKVLKDHPHDVVQHYPHPASFYEVPGAAAPDAEEA